MNYEKVKKLMKNKKISDEQRKKIKHKYNIEVAIKFIKHIDEDILLDISNYLSDISNKYFYKRNEIGENTIKLILYKNDKLNSNCLDDIINNIHEVDNIKIKPFDRKLSSKRIDIDMFTPYIDNEEKDKILEVYKKCRKEGYKEIKDLNKNISKYVEVLKSIYRSYVSEVIPMLASNKDYSIKDYNNVIKNIFNKYLELK